MPYVIVDNNCFILSWLFPKHPRVNYHFITQHSQTKLIKENYPLVTGFVDPLAHNLPIIDYDKNDYQDLIDNKSTIKQLAKSLNQALKLNSQHMNQIKELETTYLYFDDYYIAQDTAKQLKFQTTIMKDSEYSDYRNEVNQPKLLYPYQLVFINDYQKQLPDFKIREQQSPNDQSLDLETGVLDPEFSNINYIKKLENQIISSIQTVHYINIGYSSFFLEKPAWSMKPGHFYYGGRHFPKIEQPDSIISNSQPISNHSIPKPKSVNELLQLNK